jgi:hypothetical protein
MSCLNFPGGWRPGESPEIAKTITEERLLQDLRS